ncbi:hypothetical protein AAMO2058_000629400 [Amorphochlora amoebiformis]
MGASSSIFDVISALSIKLEGGYLDEEGVKKIFAVSELKCHIKDYEQYAENRNAKRTICCHHEQTEKGVYDPEVVEHYLCAKGVNLKQVIENIESATKEATERRRLTENILATYLIGREDNHKDRKSQDLPIKFTRFCFFILGDFGESKESLKSELEEGNPLHESLLEFIQGFKYLHPDWDITRQYVPKERLHKYLSTMNLKKLRMFEERLTANVRIWKIVEIHHQESRSAVTNLNV